MTAERSAKRDAAFLGSAITLAILLRGAMILLAPPTAEAILTPLNDSTDYHVLALGLMEGRGWVEPISGEPTAFRPPLYPLFLAAIYTAFGTGSLVAVAWIQTLLAGFATWLCARLAKAAGFDSAVGIWAALGYALYPAFVLQTAQILTEELGRVLILGGAVCLLESRRQSGLRGLILAGVFFALAVLNKSVLAAAMPFLSFLAAGNPTAVGWRRWMMRGVAFALPALLVIGCWTARNFAVSGHLVPVSTNFPITFATGVTRFSYYTNTWYGDRVQLLEVPDDHLVRTQLRYYRGIMDEINSGPEWTSAAKGWIRENPGVFAMMTARKTLHYWGPFVRNRPLLRAVALASMGPLLLFGWLGIYSALRSDETPRRAAFLALAVALPTTIPYAISQPDVRYRLAFVDMLWMPFAALMVARFVKTVQISPTMSTLWGPR